MTPTEKGKKSATRGKTSAAEKKKKAGAKTSSAAAATRSSKPAAKKSAEKRKKPAARTAKAVKSKAPKPTTKKPEAKRLAAEPAPQQTAPKPKAAWEPQLVVFACNWCSYAGADTAGVSRIQHQPNFRMIRVMCSGRIQPAFVLRAFEKGADGVLVSGCHFGDCHYIFGNERAVEQFDKTKNMCKLIGIEEGRIRLEWISAAEGARFAQVINEFTDQVRALGPIPFSSNRPIEQTEDVA